MRPQLETIFENLYDDYGHELRYSPFEVPRQSFINSIQRIIKDTEQQYLENRPVEIVKIRSDAKYFLVVILIKWLNCHLD